MTETISAAEYRVLFAEARKPRLTSRRTVVDGESFQSEREARRWCELKIEQRAGRIRDLQRQVRYPLSVNGHLICVYISDFTYHRGDALIVEDVKAKVITKREERATRTELYRLKKKLVAAVYGITITEV